MFLSKLEYSELVQRLFEKMTFFLVDPLPAVERECTDFFGTHSKCSYHGAGAIMQVEGKEWICEQCEIMSEEKRQSLKGGTPKVRQVKLRIMMTEAINGCLP